MRVVARCVCVRCVLVVACCGLLFVVCEFVVAVCLLFVDVCVLLLLCVDCGFLLFACLLNECCVVKCCLVWLCVSVVCSLLYFCRWLLLYVAYVVVVRRCCSLWNA